MLLAWATALNNISPDLSAPHVHTLLQNIIPFVNLFLERHTSGQKSFKIT
jgi:hypothetical protein